MTLARPLLPDVNVLVALAWPSHQFHREAVARLQREPAPRWATCALTQLGFVRVSSNANVTGVPQSPATCVALLGLLTADSKHAFIESLPELASCAGAFERIVGHQQVTDAYLIELARAAGVTLLTFDGRLLAVDDDRGNVEILTPVQRRH